MLLNVQPITLLVSRMLQTSVAFFALGCTCGATGRPANDAQTSTDGGGGADVGSPIQGTLSIVPAEAMLTVENGVHPTQSFRVFHTLNGVMNEVTSTATFAPGSRNGVVAGQVANATFTPNMGFAGASTLSANYRGLSASANIEITVRNTRTETSAPANAATLLSTATSAAALTLQVVYPEANTNLPPNLGTFETHWTDSQAFDAYKVTYRGRWFELNTIVGRALPSGSWSALSVEEWNVLQTAASGRDVEIEVTALATQTPALVARATRTIRVASEAVRGGIYYWNTLETAIFRHDMDNAGQSAQRFLPRATTAGQRCVGCHSIKSTRNSDGDSL